MTEVTTTTVEECIWRLLRTGVSVIPINHATKRPLASVLPVSDEGKPEWKPFQERLALSFEVDSWLEAGVKSIALVCGKASGNVELIDFDDNSEAKPTPYTADDSFQPWLKACGDLVEQYDLPIWKTGGNGYQVAWRCDEIAGNTKLAWVPDESAFSGRKVAIETRGEGGYALIPPSVHPSGNRYQMIRGDLARIPRIPADVRTQLLAVARSLDLAPAVEKVTSPEAPKVVRTYTNGSADVIQRFNDLNPIIGILANAGYEWTRGGRFRRPGGKSPSVEVLTDENISFHWSSNDPLNRTNGDGKPKPIDPFEVFTVFSHGGKHEAAFIAAKKELGLWTEKRNREAEAAMPSWMSDAPPVDYEPLPEDEAAGWVVADEQQAEEAEEPNPLNVAVKKLDLGWIDAYAELVSALTLSPDSFNRLTGLTVAATAIQRNAWLPMAWGDIYANIYAVIVAQSSYYHKGGAMGKARDIMRRAGIENLLLPNDFSYEGLVKTLSNRPTGLVTNNEAHRVLGSHVTKYLANLKPTLTDLFDCTPFERELSSCSVKVAEPYLNILGTTTPSRFHDSVTSIDWQDGFLVRWLFETPDKEPDFDAISPMLSSEHLRQMTALSGRLAEIAKRPATAFLIDQDAHAIWADWRKSAMKAAYRYGDDVIGYFVERYSTYALKFSIILSALNGIWGRVDAGTMQTAMDLADYYKHNVYRLLSDKTKHQVRGDKLVKIFSIIKRQPSLSTSKLCQLSNMRKAELAPVIEKLLDNGYIGEEVASTNGRRYRAIVENIPTRAWR